MRKLSIVRWILLLMLAVTTAFAADVTGTWTGQVNGPDGGGMSMAFHFKQDGTKLTGTVDGPMGDPMPISEGKVEGEKISFVIKVDMGGGETKITHEGTVKGDEIKLNVKMEGGPEGGPGLGPMTLKRSK
jgi:Rieske Fe-S protein